MKRNFRYKILGFYMTLMILTTLIFRPININADSKATFQNGMLVLTPEGINGAKPDFFKEHTSNLLPGDTRTFAITLKNNSSERVKFYFWASDTDFASNENGKEVSDRLLSLIGLKIEMLDSSVIYLGPASGRGDSHAGASKIIGTGRADAIPLGWLESNTSKTMNITINVPTTLDNDYQGVLAAVDWTFLCEIYETPITPTPPPTNPPVVTPTPTTPPTITPEITPEVTPELTPEVTPEALLEDDSSLEENEISEGDGGETDETPEGIIIINDKDLGKLPQTGTVAGIVGNSSKISSVVFLLLVVCFILGYWKNKMKNTSN